MRNHVWGLGWVALGCLLCVWALAGATTWRAGMALGGGGNEVPASSSFRAGLIGEPPIVTSVPAVQMDRQLIQGRVQGLSPQGTELLVVRNDLNEAKGSGTISSLVLHDARTGQFLKTITGPSGEDADNIECAIFSPDQKHVATGSWYGRVRLWDIETRRQVGEWNGWDHDIEALAFSPDGKTLAYATADVGNRHEIHGCTIDDKKEVFLLISHAGDVAQMLFTPDGKRMIVGSQDQTVQVWDIEERKPVMTLEGHTLGITGVAVSPDGKLAASTGRDGRLCLWDLGTGKLIRSVRQPENARGNRTMSGAAFTLDGKRLLSVSWVGTQLWDVETGQALAAFKGATGRLLMLPNGEEFISGPAIWTIPKDAEAVAGGIVPAEAASPGRQVRVMGPVMNDAGQGSDRVQSLVLPGQGKEVMAGFGESHRSFFVRWDAATGKETGRVEAGVRPQADGTRKVLAISADGKVAALGGEKGKLFLVDAATGLDLRELAPSSTTVVLQAAFSPDGQFLVSAGSPREAGGESDIRVWRVATGELVRMLHGETDSIYALLITPDGKFAISGGGGWDKVENRSGDVRCFVHVWDVATGAEIRKLEGHEGYVCSLGVSADGKRLISGAHAGPSFVWDLETGKEVCRLSAHFNRDGSGATTAVALSADGLRALTGGADHDIRYTDLESGKELARFELHKGAVTALRFLGDGKQALSAGADGTVRVWELP